MLFPRPLRWPLVVAAIAVGAFLTHGQSPSPSIPLRLIVVNSAAEADALHTRIAGGADFGVLAREKSIDPTSLDGGLLGKVDPANLRAELRDALEHLAPGQISPVFKLPAGFAILKLLQPDELAALDDTERARQFAVSAEGSVRFDFDISGINEAESAL